MAINKLWEGTQVVDKDGNRAYVTRQDAKELAKHFGINKSRVDWPTAFAAAAIPIALIVYGIVAVLTSK